MAKEMQKSNEGEGSGKGDRNAIKIEESGSGRKTRRNSAEGSGDENTTVKKRKTDDNSLSLGDRRSPPNEDEGSSIDDEDVLCINESEHSLDDEFIDAMSQDMPTEEEAKEEKHEKDKKKTIIPENTSKPLSSLDEMAAELTAEGQGSAADKNDDSCGEAPFDYIANVSRPPTPNQDEDSLSHILNVEETVNNILSVQESVNSIMSMQASGPVYGIVATVQSNQLRVEGTVSITVDSEDPPAQNDDSRTSDEIIQDAVRDIESIIGPVGFVREDVERVENRGDPKPKLPEDE
ncbi:uncharacterized protein LOC126978811 [Leptidea sinapis]|uniref:uncharacterized protein LOC126978811 n=1 Tax=Leptidea sinapis TaxID=189913 RepID=UPI0021400A48|nr:uncharacterized protein LOC126978811 [Leptidea sinapis]